MIGCRLLVIVTAILPLAGCLESQLDRGALATGGPDMPDIAAPTELLVEGTTHYSVVAQGPGQGPYVREGDELPSFHLPYPANLTVEIRWPSPTTAPEIRASFGTRDGALASARGGSPIVLTAASAPAGEYIILIDPMSDPGILVEETFRWRVTAQRVPIEATPTDEVALGTFGRGLVAFAFTPTGPDHEVWADVENSSVSVMASLWGSLMIYGERVETVGIRGNGIPLIAVDPRPASSGSNGFGIIFPEEAWNQTHWVVFGGADVKGPSAIHVGYSGKDVRASTHLEADARLLTREDWTGALDAHAGRGRLGGTVAASRSVSFGTTNGTFLVYSMGGFAGPRVDDVTLTNSTTTRTWTGASFLAAGLDADLYADDHTGAGVLLATGPPDEWELSIRGSARGDAWEDVVFVADAALPPELHWSS